MRLARLALIVAVLAMIVGFPILARDALQVRNSPSAFAASASVGDPTERVYRDDNDNSDNGNESNDNDDNDNGDTVCYRNLNSNEEVPCDFVGNDNRGPVYPVRRRGESITGPTKCFDNREVGVVQLGTGPYDVTVTVMPHSSFGQTTRLTLRAIDPSEVPAVPGTLVDSVVFALDAQSDCSGVAIGTLPNAVNLGITYNVVPTIDKARLQIARLEGGNWVNVDTVPDPVAGNPYVSTTIRQAGTYALFQR